MAQLLHKTLRKVSQLLSFPILRSWAKRERANEVKQQLSQTQFYEWVNNFSKDQIFTESLFLLWKRKEIRSLITMIGYRPYPSTLQRLLNGSKQLNHIGQKVVHLRTRLNNKLPVLPMNIIRSRHSILDSKTSIQRQSFLKLGQ